jgi:hypothetical protein
MTAYRILTLAGFTAAVACRARPVETRIVVVTATPTSVVASPAVLVEPPRTPEMDSAEFSFPVNEPTQTPVPATPRVAPALELRQEPTLETLHDQMERCLHFDAERGSPPGTSVYGVVMLRVVVRNSCDVGFSGGQAWFEARASSPTGGTAGRATGRFQTAILARGSAETFIQLDGVAPDAPYYYKASLWWAAGGGRKADE